MSHLKAQNNQAAGKQAQTAAHNGVTELVLTKHSPDQLMLLMPMIAHLSRTADRWITWVTPDAVDRSVIESYGVDTHKLRIIHESEQKTVAKIMWDALSNGTSHTVIGTISGLSEKSIGYMEQAASKGNAKALLVRYR
jgi:cell division inhibitor SulA